jgi:tetratricopeptide (TPR) repeat protein
VRQRLAQLFAVPTDLDYVQAFQDLSLLNLEVRRDGPSVATLLRKAGLERNVGNHGAALGAVIQAHELDPQNPEVHYGLGVAHFYLALAKAGALPVGPKPTDLPDDEVSALLSLAVESFSRVLELNPADEDAAQDLTAIADVLAVGATEDQLSAALRAR